MVKKKNKESKKFKYRDYCTLTGESGQEDTLLYWFCVAMLALLPAIVQIFFGSFLFSFFVFVLSVFSFIGLNKWMKKCEN